MSVEILGEVLQQESFQLQSLAVKYMKSLAWNKYFTGSKATAQYPSLKASLEPQDSREASETSAVLSKNQTTDSKSHSLADCFVLFLRKIFAVLGRETETCTSISTIINLFLSNPKVSVHGESVIGLYELSFRSSISRAAAAVPIEGQQQEASSSFSSVESYIFTLLSKCERQRKSEDRKAKPRPRFSSTDSSDIKLFHSFGVVAPQESNWLASSVQGEDTFESNRSSVEQEPMFLTAQEGYSMFARHYLINLVDQTEIYFEKLRQANTSSTISDALQQSIHQEQDISILAVPQPGDKPAHLYGRSFTLPILNERREAAGKFGWCYMCRKKANFYCKDHRRPVCSRGCKDSLTGLLGRFGSDRQHRQAAQRRPAAGREFSQVQTRRGPADRVHRGISRLSHRE